MTVVTNSPGTMSQSGAGTGWTLTADGGSTANPIGGNGSTRLLIASNFGFSVPSNAVVLGVAVGFTRFNSGSGSIHDNTGAPALYYTTGLGTQTSHTSPAKWTTSPTAVTYGSATDLWGTAVPLTPAVVNSSGFGVQMAAHDQSANQPAGAVVQTITMTVYYTTAVGPSGIVSAEAFGASHVSAGLVRVLTPSGIVSAQALGTPRVVSIVYPAGIASAQAFGADSVTALVRPGGGAGGYGAPAYAGAAYAGGGGGVSVPVGTTGVFASGITTAQAFGATTVIGPRQTIAPSGIASAETFGVTAVAAGVKIVNPSGVASAQAFGSPLVTPIEGVHPTGVASSQAFGGTRVTVLRGTQTVAPSGIASVQVFGTPVLTTGGVAIFPTGIPSAEALGVGGIGKPVITPTLTGVHGLPLMLVRRAGLRH